MARIASWNGHGMAMDIIIWNGHEVAMEWALLIIVVERACEYFSDHG